jgi:glyoxylase-like metal-dependent hydrolase (beta-lactamase superfamily II)
VTRVFFVAGALSLLLSRALPVARGPIAPGDDARGRAVLDAALTALGGTERIRQVASWDVEGAGRENLSAETQGLAPEKPTWRPHEERLAVDAKTLAVAWYRRTPRNDESLRWRRLIYRPDAFGFVDFVSSFGALRPNPVPESERRGLARRVPHLLLLEAATRATRVSWREELRIDGQPHDAIDVVLPGDIRLVLTVSREPSLLRRAEYRCNLPTRGDVTVSWEWLGWKPNAELGYVPSGHRVEIDGTLFQEVTYSRFRAPSAEVADLLEVPPDLRGRSVSPSAAPPDAPETKPLPANGEIAPGVHVANLSGFVVMFVEFRDFVVALEAPESHPGFEAIPPEVPSRQVSLDYLALVHETVPGKPVRTVVVSHHHSDHMGGIRRFAAAGAILIVAPGDQKAALAALDRPHSLAPDDWTGTSADAKVETVADRRVITDGSRKLEIWNVGKNPHTDDNLFAWLPEERIVFEGDLFYYEEGGTFPPSGRGRMNGFFARWLRDHGMEPRAVYGVHNDGAAPPERLQQSLELR